MNSSKQQSKGRRTIRETLEHLIGSEAYYLNHITGTLHYDNANEDWSNKSLDESFEISQFLESF